VPHDVAEEDAGAVVGDGQHVKEIAAEDGARAVHVVEAKAALRGGDCGWETGIATGQQGLLDFARHVEVGLHFGVPLPQLFGILLALGFCILRTVI